MQRWGEFAAAAPGIATVGKGLLYSPGQGEVGILATVANGVPHVAPVCPIFTAAGIYLSVSDVTPKLAHLRADGRYALHAQVGADDREFQIGGVVREVLDDAERGDVHTAIQFEHYDPSHPIFELLITRALAVSWPNPGQSHKETWRADD